MATARLDLRIDEEVKAKAEKEANELKTRALTPQILEQMWIESGMVGCLPIVQ